MNQPILELSGISKAFDGHSVLKDLKLSVFRGEFLSILGPSGCGKTTLLRIIAGLCPPDFGTVLLNGEDLTNTPPNKRNVNTIFQNYALFPHMNVGANIEYGLKIRGVKKAERQERMRELLHLVQLDGMERQMPSTLSGGQKQRVAIARALINDPEILLLDEPLGALDLQLRRYLQTELKRLQKKLGITFLYITHDQEEAMNLSDRIAVMSGGVLEQTGTPQEIYDHPKTAFVAQFIGTTNLFSAKTFSESELLFEDAVFPVSTPLTPYRDVTVSVRCERLLLSRKQTKASVPATVTENTYLNGILKTQLKTDRGTQMISTRNEERFELGERVYLSFLPQDAVIVENSGKEALYEA